MNKLIDLALNVLYQRQLTSREQLLNEMLRVKMTLKQLEQYPHIIDHQDKLFQFMKETTEDELGFFPADRDDFLAIFTALRNIDLIDFTVEIYKNDRMGTVISPLYLTSYISERIRQLQPQRILITEAEKHLSGLREIIRQSQHAKFTLTTQLKSMHILLRLAFGGYQNVTVRFQSIYTECLQQEQFDYIYTLPSFGYKPEEAAENFLTRDSDGVAIENMLRHLNGTGTLDIIMPAKITFAGGSYGKLRTLITDHYHVKNIYILPEGTFRPLTSIKTYLFTLTAQPQPSVELGTLTLTKDKFDLTEQKTIPTTEFLSHRDWRIELLLADDDQHIRMFKGSNLPKVKLKEVAEVFRGKSILKKDTTPGNIAVLNISNIENGEINYQDLDTIREEEHKIMRYQLQNGDVVLSCRGTAIKSAVFADQNKIIIASANLIVIRPKEKVRGEYIKIFLESPIGLAIIKSFQRGTTIMNINHADIMEMEIPLIPRVKQQQMIRQYQGELNIYKQTIHAATSRWGQVKESIYNDLI